MRALTHLTHLTLLSGHSRVSPRAEVETTVINRLRKVLSKGGSAALWDTGWAVLRMPAPPGGYLFDLSYKGVEVTRCWLASSETVADTLWPDACRGYPGIDRPAAPWLAVGLLLDGMMALQRTPQIMFELGDLERCVAWAMLPK